MMVVAQTMGLDTITNKPWYIKASNALTGDGINEGVAWLIERL